MRQPLITAVFIFEARSPAEDRREEVTVRRGEDPRAGAVVPCGDGEGEHKDDCKRELGDSALAVRSAEISEYSANIFFTPLSIAGQE